jgi:ABC-type phosphate/phosphonate transport system substrate-binding protein
VNVFAEIASLDPYVVPPTTREGTQMSVKFKRVVLAGAALAVLAVPASAALAAGGQCQCGDTRDFFGSLVESGAHQRSLSLVAAGAVDASAIDSTVLETELLHTAELRRQLRVVTTLGPSPIPPLVVSRALSLAVRNDLRRMFLAMHHDPRGSNVLSMGRVHQYVEVMDADYDAIGRMAVAGTAIAL